MAQLNYHHLQYFYLVAVEGSVNAAAERLHVTPQTVSGQLSTFEHNLGVTLFDRKGKRLLLNQAGELAFEYAEKIFKTGQELEQQLKMGMQGNKPVFAMAVTDAIPKVLAFGLIKPHLSTLADTKLVFREGEQSTLLAELALNKIELIVSDRPVDPLSSVKAFNHFIGESGVSFFCAPALAESLAENFPLSLDQQPILLAGDRASLSSQLLAWFDSLSILPHIVAEFDDSALLKLFGQEGMGVFCAPTSIEKHVCKQYGVISIGRTTQVKERYYVITMEKLVRHPLTQEIINSAAGMLNHA